MVRGSAHPRLEPFAREGAPLKQRDHRRPSLHGGRDRLQCPPPEAARDGAAVDRCEAGEDRVGGWKRYRTIFLSVECSEYGSRSFANNKRTTALPANVFVVAGSFGNPDVAVAEHETRDFLPLAARSSLGHLNVVVVGLGRSACGVGIGLDANRDEIARLCLKDLLKVLDEVPANQMPLTERIRT